MGGSPDRETQARRREARLAEALRENLKRRKAQQRGRAASTPPEAAKPERAPDGSH
jgi:hypothetical protein